MKSVWQGTLSFGLVSIDVSLVSAINKNVVGFTLLCATCKTPITYERHCLHCDKPVSWDNVVKGLKTKNGYIVLTQEKIHELKPEKTDSVTIHSFVDGNQLRIIYFENHYYCVPRKKNDAAYALFCRALIETQKVAIGTFVMRDREHVCAITPYENGLVLTTLYYAYQIRSIDSLKSLENQPKAKKEELQLATELINRLSKKSFHLEEYKDSFVQELIKAIKSGKTQKLAKAKKSQSSKSTGLLDTLKKSLK